MATDPHKKPVHALVVPVPAHGHIYPMMELAYRLANSGCIITFVHPQRNYNHIMQRGKDRLRYAPTFNTVVIEDGLPRFVNAVRPSAVDFDAAMRKVETGVHALMEKLMSSTEKDGHGSVSCIISDIFLTGVQDIANKFKVPKVDFYTCSAAAFAINLHIPLLISSGYIPVKDTPEASSKQITCIPGLPPLTTNDIQPEFLVQNLSDTMFQVLTRPFKRIQEPACILVNTFYELERQVIDSLKHNLRFYPVGPLLPSTIITTQYKIPSTVMKSHPSIPSSSMEIAEEDVCLKWLDAQAPCSVVYVSFGSFIVLSSQELQELALGLEASLQPFLWVSSDLQSTDSCTPDRLPKGFRSRTRERCLFVDWAPQLYVLSHPSVGGFVSHCGWNSTLESISMGIPILGWPREQDQSTNLKFIVDEWKVGIPLAKKEDGKMCKRGVEKAVRDLMLGEIGRKIRKNTSRLRDAAVRSSHESSQANLQAFIELVKRKQY